MFKNIAFAIILFVTAVLSIFFVYVMIKLATMPKEKNYLERTAPEPVNWDSLQEVKNNTPWSYSTKEDRMTSAITYFAEQRSEENIRTNGHWENKSSTTTTTKTEITEKKPLFKNKTALDRALNPKKFNATTSTTTTSSTHPEWVGKEGPMVLSLKFREGKKTNVIIYSSTHQLTVDFSTVRIRFDKNEPKRYSITPTAVNKNQTDGFIINSPSEFITSLRGATTMLMQMSDDDDDFIFTFHVKNLKWEH